MTTKQNAVCLTWKGNAKQLRTILNLQYWRLKMDAVQKKRKITLLEYIQEIADSINDYNFPKGD